MPSFTEKELAAVRAARRWSRMLAYSMQAIQIDGLERDELAEMVPLLDSVLLKMYAVALESDMELERIRALENEPMPWCDHCGSYHSDDPAFRESLKCKRKV